MELSKISHIWSLGRWDGPMFGSVMESIFCVLVEAIPGFVEIFPQRGVEKIWENLSYWIFCEFPLEWGLIFGFKKVIFEFWNGVLEIR